MLASRLFLALGYPYAARATECLVGCLVQGMSPFDEDSLAVWGDRGACDSLTVGCEVSAINYPSTSYQGALWASTSGSDGSTSCTCDICDPYPYSDTTSYMEEETSLWSRIHCYLAASEASGYDVSPCVAAILDTQTLPCVDDVYEPPAVDQFDCDENGIKDISEDDIDIVCNWDGDTHRAQELFSSTSASSSTTVTSVAVNTTSCLVGCLVQGISPFDEDNLAVWDNRGTCDSNTIGCDVIAINYPSSIYQGALWASSWGTEGSTSCTCSICDPYPWGDTTSYMEDEISLWSRIHCYLAAAEASGYDVSPCVAAITETEALPCVDDVYEPPTVGQFDCELNGIKDLADDDSYIECSWGGEYRSTDELYNGTRVPSPLPDPTLAPAPSSTRGVAPEPGITSTHSPDSAPASPSGTSSPIEGGPTLPLVVEGVSCDVGNTCQENLCCHPESNTCGRKYTYCQERDFADGPRCCSGVDGDPSASNVCSEDSICDEPVGLTPAEVAGVWVGIITGVISITVAVWKGYQWCEAKR